MSACSIKVRGVVQGVGFRPFVFRLARANTLAGWVLNGEEGVEIFLEGSEPRSRTLRPRTESCSSPPAAQIAEIEVATSEPVGPERFHDSRKPPRDHPTTRISPDLPVCDDCLKELFDPADERYLYPYINCTNCGPRYTVTRRLPYDRQNTTMDAWPLDEFCAAQYRDPANRRFHAQPVACASCGPGYYLQSRDKIVRGNEPSIRKTAELLAAGKIVAIKGLGGYHLACDAKNAVAIEALRERKYRKEKPFALMARDLDAARARSWSCRAEAEALLTSAARPIVIAPAKAEFPGVAPGSHELGVMLPYTPLHHLLFHFGAPDVLVMTSANRSSEPIAYEDSDALVQLSAIADAFLIGERPIARRVDDSVARAGAFGPVILRRSRGYAPGAVTTIPTERPILALGADLKNTVTLVVRGQAFVSQHIGDLSDYQCFHAYQQTIDDLLSMYDVHRDHLLVVHDLHPQYASTQHAQSFVHSARVAVQHHRAHIASVVAERREWDRRVIGISFDGTGYGDDGTIWGGELFCRQRRRRLRARRTSVPRRVARRRCGCATSAAGRRRFSRPGGRLTGSACRTIQFSVALPRRAKARRQKRALIRLHIHGQALRRGRRASRLHASRELRRSGGDVARTTGAWRENAGFLSVSLRRAGIRFSSAAARRGVTPCARPPTRRNCPSLHARHRLRPRRSGQPTCLDSCHANHRFFRRRLSERTSARRSARHSQILSIRSWTNREVSPNDGGISLGQAALTAFGRLAEHANHL